MKLIINYSLFSFENLCFFSIFMVNSIIILHFTEKKKYILHITTKNNVAPKLKTVPLSSGVKMRVGFKMVCGGESNMASAM